MSSRVFSKPRYYIAGGVAIAAVVALGATQLPVFADDPVPPVAEPIVAVSDTDGDGILDAPNTVSAVLAAVDRGVEVEDRSQRTASETVIANSDWTMSLRDFGEAVRVQQNGQWVDVNYNLAKQPDGSWEPKVSPVDISIDGGSSREAARVGFEDGKSLAVTWPQDLPKPTIDGGVATYKISDATELVIAVTSSGVNARIRLNKQPANDDPVFRLGFQTAGARLAKDGGGLKLVGDDGKQLGQTSTLVAWDATKDAAGDPARIVPLKATLKSESKRGRTASHNLELTAPEGYLSDPRTIYPVTIDPDVSSMHRLRDTWVRSGVAAKGSTSTLVVGRGAGSSNPARAYLQFNGALSNKEIVSAELGLWQYYAPQCSNRRMNVNPVADVWADTITWPTRPTVLPAWGGYGGFLDINRGATGCAGGFNTVDVTKAVRAWAEGAMPNRGLALVASDETNTSYERRFCSFNPDTSTHCNSTDKMPYLKITYLTDAEILNNQDKAVAESVAEEIVDLETFAAMTDGGSDSFPEPGPDSGPEADVASAKSAVPALLTAQDAIGIITGTNAVERITEVHHRIDSGQVAADVAAIWAPASTAKAVSTWSDGLLMTAGEPGYIPYTETQFVVDEWQKVTVTGNSATLLLRGHGTYLTAAEWGGPEPDQKLITLSRATTGSDWKLVDIQTRAVETSIEPPSETE